MSFKDRNICQHKFIKVSKKEYARTILRKQKYIIFESIEYIYKDIQESKEYIKKYSTCI